MLSLLLLLLQADPSPAMSHGGPRSIQRDPAVLRLLQPHHQHAPEDVRTGSGLSGGYRLGEMTL